MSIQDLELIQTREDGKTYVTTIGKMDEDARIQSEKVHAKQVRKAKWAKWRKKWMPRIIEGIKILAIVAVVGYLLYLLFWVVIGAIMLMAVGAGMSEGGQAGQAQTNYYNQQRYNRPTNNPKYWRD